MTPVLRRRIVWSMPADQAISLIEALSEEFTALRPESGYTADSKGNLFSKVHAKEKPFAALCISGGGIRSATFALGALQGLAEQGFLAEFDYLSIVSGGGAGNNAKVGLEKVIPFLRRSAPPIPPGDPDPIQHLREYNSYLSPNWDCSRRTPGPWAPKRLPRSARGGTVSKASSGSWPTSPTARRSRRRHREAAPGPPAGPLSFSERSCAAGCDGVVFMVPGACTPG